MNIDEINKLSDKEVVRRLLCKEEELTKWFLYRKCYPLFKSIHNNYHTDCETCIEFINEIYIHIMTIQPETGKNKLEGFKFECSLLGWLKVVSIYYCYHQFDKKIKRESLINNSEGSDRLNNIPDSTIIDMTSINFDDVVKILSLMPNRRYQILIRLRYLEEKSNEETAEILGMSMVNYYNKHKLAKEQFTKVLRKEESYGK